MQVKDEFLNLVHKYIYREGLGALLRWLDQSDFYTAPASTRYHGAFEGGLALHSINVFSQLKNLCKWYDCDASEESIAIVSLFHDLCKVGYYKQTMRWRKNEADKWEHEDFAYGGHGSKSVFLIQSFIKLTPEEASAINCHMGQFDATIYSNPSAVYSRNKLAWLLHVADEAATYITEGDNE